MSAIRLWVLVILVLAYAGLDVASDQGLCRQSCGDKPVPYPFGVDSNCGNPNFQGLLSCNDSAGFQDARLQLNTDSGNYDVSIDSSNHTISINDTTLLNCSTLEGPRSADFSRPDGRFNLSMRSSFIAFFHNDSKRPTYCDKSGSVTFSNGSCGGGPWNATYRGDGLWVFSPPCSNAASTLSFCITHLPPDGSSELPYSSILYKTPHSGDGFSIVCSPTIVYSYNDRAAPAGIMRSFYPRLQPPQEPAEYPPGAVESPSSSSPSSAKNLGPVLGGVAAGGAGVASFILCLLLGYRRLKSWRSRRSHGKQMRNIAIIMDAGSGSSSDLTRFSYQELATATKNFDPEKRIGGGGFSVVYRGKLKDGRQVAVKKLHQANLQGRQQFMAELTVLSQAKHPNLVQLYGSCPEPRILVYEYVANGTLAEHLHGSRSVPFLNCRTRLSIAVEVAEALAYLHSLHPPIVHRDVKSSNILLDEGCRAKVGDFGLSRLHDVDRTHVSTAPQGTPGYLDPDYHQTYHLSDKSDVYSLGVVLMELVSGKKAVDMSRERGEINLSAMAAARIQSGATEELLDPGLASSAGGKDAAMALAELGFQCLATEKDDRPSMQEVVSKIKSIQYMAFAFPSPVLSPLRAQESSRLIKFKSEDWVPSESYPGLDDELQGR